MANFMISPILPQVAPGAGLDWKAQLPVGSDGSFAQHLDRQIREGLPGQGNLFGVQAKDEAVFTETSGPHDPPPSVEAVLQQLMVDLKAVVDRPASEPGEWTFQLQDLGHLEKLAAEAGMDATLLAPLQKAMAEGKGLPLSDLFNALQENFKAQDAATEVTVAETYLPLLETFLTKLAVPPETIQHLDNQAVNGVDRLDLIAYLQGMQAVAAQGQGQAEAPTFVLSDWEVEQLSAMLTEAGVPASEIALMIPERPSLEQKALAGIRPEEGNLPVTMTLSRLESILRQAVAAVSEARPQADLPAFFAELNTVLDLAGFASQDVGWSPVVQGTVSDTFDELRKLVDEATVRVETVPGSHGHALGLERLLQKIQALREQAQGQSGHDQAKTLTPEVLNRALQQALAEMEGLRSQTASLPGLLSRVNSILARGGLTITAMELEVSPQTAIDPQRLEAARPLLVQALSEVFSEDPDTASLSGLLGKVNSLLVPAGMELTPQGLGPTPPQSPLIVQPQGEASLTLDPATAPLNRELQRELFAQVLNEVQSFNPQAATVAPEALPEALVQKVNTVLAPAGVMLMALRQEAPAGLQLDSTQEPPTAETLEQLFAQALNAVEESLPQQTNLTQGLLEKVNTILAPAGLALTPTSTEPSPAISLNLQEAPPLPANAGVEPTGADGLTPGFPSELLTGHDSSAQELSPEVVQEQVQTILTQPGLAGSESADLLEPILPAASGPERPDLRQETELAEAREEKAAEITREDDELADQWLASGDEELPVARTSGDSESGEQVSAQTGEELEPVETAAPRGGERRDEQLRGVVGLENKAPEQAQAAGVKVHAPRPHLTPELQQFAFEQISQGVLRGLKNNEHHLALTLYPKELGEVKVDLQVRGNHLSMTFVMENQKVKEAMESSMGEFKENLERRGFSLGAMSVSVDQHQNQEDGSKRFMAAWEQMQLSRQQQEGRGPLVTSAAPVNSGNATTRTPQGGISLFV